MGFFNRFCKDEKSPAIEILARSIGFIAPFQFGVATSVTDHPEEVALRLYEIARDYDLAIVVLKQQIAPFDETFVAYLLPPEMPRGTAIGKDHLQRRLSANGYLVTEQSFTALSGIFSVLKLKLRTREEVSLLLAILEAQALKASRQVEDSADWAYVPWY